MIKKILGVVMILIAVALFIITISGENMLHIAIASLLFLLSLLAGRNIAYLVHDSQVLKRRSRNFFSPNGMISMWMLFFIIMVIIYTISFQVFFKSISIFVAGISGSYMGIAYSIICLIGSYILFSYQSSLHPDKLYSSWGKRMERMSSGMGGMMKNMGRIF